MREIRQSGSEGGAGYIPVPTPINGGESLPWAGNADGLGVGRCP